MGQRARRARRAGGVRREAALSGPFGLFGLSCWPDRQTHQANQKNQMNKTDERGGQALGGGAVFALVPSSNGVGEIGGTGPKL